MFPFSAAVNDVAMIVLKMGMGGQEGGVMARRVIIWHPAECVRVCMLARSCLLSSSQAISLVLVDFSFHFFTAAYLSYSLRLFRQSVTKKLVGQRNRKWR